MLGKVYSCGIEGIQGKIVTVEADASNGLPSYETVGLPDKAVSESRERIKIALRNCGFVLPPKRITINLAPADFRKVGTVYDLPIALALLQAMEQLPANSLQDTIVVGELALDGSVRNVNGILPMALAARKHGFRRLICPAENAQEASYLEEIDVIPAQNIHEIYEMLLEQKPWKIQPKIEWKPKVISQEQDFVRIRGQFLARRASEIAAAGGHNMLLTGLPGAGKTMIAKAIPSILPDLTFEEALDISCIYSAIGQLQNQDMVRQRPFRAPHHSASLPALVGGGSIIKPGEISLAHHGVLFLDEIPEFSRTALEALRQPLEDGFTTIARARSKEVFPSQFMFIAAMNPCPCGYHGAKKHACTCTPKQIERYRAKLSGPLLDRIDLFVAMEELEYADFYGDDTVKPESSESIRLRVNECRERQKKRFENSRIFSNAQMTQLEIEQYCIMSSDAQDFLKLMFDQKNISGRAHARTLRLALTIADMDEQLTIQDTHLAEAFQYRSVDTVWS